MGIRWLVARYSYLQVIRRGSLYLRGTMTAPGSHHLDPLAPFLRVGRTGLIPSRSDHFMPDPLQVLSIIMMCAH